ncbi:MAG: CHASE2 domain-containing protein [Candidatus Bipolaricaulia bacterium]
MKIGVGVTLFLVVFFFLQNLFATSGMRSVNEWLRNFDLKTLDVRFAIRGQEDPGDEVVIIEIDEKSIAELGQWPWPRSVHGQLVNKLSEYGVKAIGFDILFPEVSRFAVDDDERFAEAIRNAGNVYLGEHFINRSQAETNLIYQQFAYRRFKAGMDSRSKKAEAYDKILPPVPVLSQYAAGIGIVDIGTPDPDKIYRWIPLVFRERFSDRLYPPFTLQLVLAYLDKRQEDAIIDRDRIEIRGITEISTDTKSRMLINYFGGRHMLPYVSYVDVLEGNVESQEFQGKIALIGYTAKGLSDLRPTPFETVPGVEVHGTIISNILNERLLSPPINWVTYLTLLILGGVLSYSLFRFSSTTGALVAGGVLVVYLVYAQLAFQMFNTVVHLFYPAVSIVIISGAGVLYGYFFEEREKRITQQFFQKYVPPHVVDEIMQNPDQVKLGGERKEITAFFSDIRGFTAMSDNISPEEVVGILNEYLPEMTQIIHEYGGTVDKYEGDAIVAFFGAPIAHEDDPGRAVRSALEMQQRLIELRNRWGEQGRAELRIGVGLATGPAVIGNVGSEDRMDYTAIGDTMNLASRLEGLNKDLNSEILISESTYEQVKDIVEVVRHSNVSIKGKGETTVYQVVSLKEATAEVEAEAPGEEVPIQAEAEE